MAAMSMSSDRFARSCEQASSYPQNELLTRTFEYALKAYRARLVKEADTIFHRERRNIFIWDLVDDAKGMGQIRILSFFLSRFSSIVQPSI